MLSLERFSADMVALRLRRHRSSNSRSSTTTITLRVNIRALDRVMRTRKVSNPFSSLSAHLMEEELTERFLSLRVDLMRCLDASGNDMNACQYYLDQLRACSAAARTWA
jgi:hypothetical protein